MKTLIAISKDLKLAGRWDIDFHLPPVGIQSFPKNILVKVGSCADIVKMKRDPGKYPDKSFIYVDISSVDVSGGVIIGPQELTGAEAPSRARKVLHAYDIIISTCRPTRGAIAIVPEEFHGQICSTGFSVIRSKENVNPFYLHFALRMPSTLEQFRKWGTGSSYPAILDEDVIKTMIPLPSVDEQDRIALAIRSASRARDEAIRRANDDWNSEVLRVVSGLEKGSDISASESSDNLLYSTSQVRERIAVLPSVEEEATSPEDDLFSGDSFEDSDDE